MCGYVMAPSGERDPKPGWKAWFASERESWRLGFGRGADGEEGRWRFVKGR